MTPDEAVKEWDELAELWKAVEQAVVDLAEGNGELALVRAAVNPCHSLANRIWIRSSPTIESLLKQPSSGQPFTLGGEVSIAQGILHVVDKEIIPATTLEQVQKAIKDGKNLIRLGRAYASP